MLIWPLSTGFVRLLWLRALCAVAEGSAEVPTNPSSLAPVLTDARVSALNGREKLPRSLGSVYGRLITLFLGGRVHGMAWPRKPTDVQPDPYEHGLAPSSRGAALLQFGLLDRRDILSQTPAPHWKPSMLHHLWITPDGFVFAADTFDSPCVFVFTRELTYHMTIGNGTLAQPTRFCADEHEVVVPDMKLETVFVFRRLDGALVRRFGDGVKFAAVCYLTDGRHVAAAHDNSDCVSVFSTDGARLRTFHTGRVKKDAGLACSSFDELFISDVDSVEICDARGWHLQSVTPAAGPYNLWTYPPYYPYTIGHWIAIVDDRVFFLTQWTSRLDYASREQVYEYKYYELIWK
jgi:hypothetical protein